MAMPNMDRITSDLTQMDEVTAAAVRVISSNPSSPGIVKVDAQLSFQPLSPGSTHIVIDPVTSIRVVSAFKQSIPEQEGFEGNEKRLQIDLKPDDSVGPIPFGREFWDELLELVSAKILDMKVTDKMEGYILSESSLFVSAHRITLITCGTTVLLGCLKKLVDQINLIGREIEYLQYSRKDFTYPWRQPPEHLSIASEYAILQQCAPDGAPFILGPLDRDHFFIYVMDKITRPSREELDMNLNIMMYGLHEDVAKHFFSDEVSTTSEATAALRKATGLSKLFDDKEVVQDQVWTPCGYSANAWTGEEYWTTHVTPEKHCSYASFETNASYPSYIPIVTEVLNVFRPERCSMIMLLDEQSPAGVLKSKGHDIGTGTYPGYTLIGRTINEFGPGYYVIKADLALKAKP